MKRTFEVTSALVVTFFLFTVAGDLLSAPSDLSVAVGVLLILAMTLGWIWYLRKTMGAEE